MLCVWCLVLCSTPSSLVVVWSSLRSKEHFLCELISSCNQSGATMKSCANPSEREVKSVAKQTRAFDSEARRALSYDENISIPMRQFIERKRAMCAVARAQVIFCGFQRRRRPHATHEQVVDGRLLRSAAAAAAVKVHTCKSDQFLLAQN